MINLIRIGDDTGHGGKMITRPSTIEYEGGFVARKSNHVSCSKHPDVSPNVIEEGDMSMTHGSIPAARHGHQQHVIANGFLARPDR